MVDVHEQAAVRPPPVGPVVNDDPHLCSENRRAGELAGLVAPVAQPVVAGFGVGNPLELRGVGLDVDLRRVDAEEANRIGAAVLEPDVHRVAVHHLDDGDRPSGSGPGRCHSWGRGR